MYLNVLTDSLIVAISLFINSMTLFWGEKSHCNNSYCGRSPFLCASIHDHLIYFPLLCDCVVNLSYFFSWCFLSYSVCAMITSTYGCFVSVWIHVQVIECECVCVFVLVCLSEGERRWEKWFLICVDIKALQIFVTSFGCSETQSMSSLPCIIKRENYSLLKLSYSLSKCKIGRKLISATLGEVFFFLFFFRFKWECFLSTILMW